VRESVIKITTMYLPTIEMEKELPDIPNIHSENDDSEVPILLLLHLTLI